MTKKRTGDPWMPGSECGRSLPPFSVNLIVRDIDASLPFYRDVLGATVHYSDVDFAALRLGDAEFMLHADHTYDGHAIYGRLGKDARGTGVELRVFGIDPDAAQRRAEEHGAEVVQPAGDRGHGWRDVMLADPDGYIWAVGVPLRGQP